MPPERSASGTSVAATSSAKAFGAPCDLYLKTSALLTHSKPKTKTQKKTKTCLFGWLRQNPPKKSRFVWLVGAVCFRLLAGVPFGDLGPHLNPPARRLWSGGKPKDMGPGRSKHGRPESHAFRQISELGRMATHGVWKQQLHW